MRVCHLGKYYPPAPGGIETHLQTLVRAQKSLGMSPHVLCMNHESTVPGGTTFDCGVQIERFDSKVSLFGLHYCPALASAIQSAETDLFHLHVPNPVMLLHLYLAQPKAPIIVTYHSDIIRQRIRAALFRPIENYVYRRVSKILVTSPNYTAGSKFLKHYTSRIEVLPMGLDLDPYLNPSDAHVAAANEIRAKYKQPIWLTTGRLIYYKGLSNAVRSLKKLPGTLVMVGGGTEEDSLRAEVKSLGLESRVAFVGYVASHFDIIPYYLASTALWFPSNARSEAYGLVQIEAMACSRPVINTDIPHSGVTWVSPHEQTGLTIPINDADALADASRRLLDESGLAERLGVAGRERAISNFDHRVMAQRSLQIYESCVK